MIDQTTENDEYIIVGTDYEQLCQSYRYLAFTSKNFSREARGASHTEALNNLYKRYPETKTMRVVYG